ncbi:MAG: right-handed parallel beta-helix repeat-containing protein [Planctomycetes bacterium]|nr:right-handed parallel beta-helix repeat-containing protein [Planctomycetota bacterium]
MMHLERCVSKGIILPAMVAVLVLLALPAYGETIQADPDNLASILTRVNPGDAVLLADGVYRGGFRLERSGTKEAPITIKAVGKSCVFDGGKRGLRIHEASYVHVEGIRFQNAEQFGLSSFGNTGVEVRRCVFANNTMIGIFTSHAEKFVVEECELFGATHQKEGIGIYLSNSGDDCVLRNCHIHDNKSNGIHINGDPTCGGDGIISRVLVEGNRIYNNGEKGGSAINLTHVQDSTFRNNLLYNNLAAGIVLYYDEGEGQYASRNNTIVNNTVYFRPGEGRKSLSLRKQSTGCTIKNNIFIGGAWSVVFAEENCFDGLVCDENVIATYPGGILFGDSTEGLEISVEDWRKKGFDRNSTIGTMPKFADPEKGDFHLLPGSVGIDIGAGISGSKGES